MLSTGSVASTGQTPPSSTHPEVQDSSCKISLPERLLATVAVREVNVGSNGAHGRSAWSMSTLFYGMKNIGFEWWPK